MATGRRRVRYFMRFFQAGFIVQLTRLSEGTYLEQIATEMGPVQFFAQVYAEYHTMLFRGLKQNALSKNHFCCNLFQVQLCTDWTITPICPLKYSDLIRIWDYKPILIN